MDEQLDPAVTEKNEGPPPIPLAEPCNCEGKCQQGVDGEYCAAWLARTHRMTFEPCENSGRTTWHRDGQCCDCHPLFPRSAVWGNA